MADDEKPLEQLAFTLENTNGYLDQVASYTAALRDEIEKTNDLLRQLLEELRSRN